MAGYLFEKFKCLSQNSQNRKTGERYKRIYEAYNNTVMPHGRHIYAKVYDMVKATMCTYPQSVHALPHWKCLLCCCAKFP